MGFLLLTQFKLHYSVTAPWHVAQGKVTSKIVDGGSEYVGHHLR